MGNEKIKRVLDATDNRDRSSAWFSRTLYVDYFRFYVLNGEIFSKNFDSYDHFKVNFVMACLSFFKADCSDSSLHYDKIFTYMQREYLLGFNITKKVEDNMEDFISGEDNYGRPFDKKSIKEIDNINTKILNDLKNEYPIFSANKVDQVFGVKYFETLKFTKEDKVKEILNIRLKELFNQLHEFA